MNSQLFSQTGQMIKLCCEYLSVWYADCVFLHHVTHFFPVNLHPVVAWNSWMSRSSLLEAGKISDISIPVTVT